MRNLFTKKNVQHGFGYSSAGMTLVFGSASGDETTEGRC